MPPGASGLPMFAIKCSLVSDMRNCPPCPMLYIIREATAGCILCTSGNPLYTAAHYVWVSIAIQTSLLQNGTKPGPSGISYLQEGVASPVFDLFPDFRVPEDVPSLKPLGYQGSPLGSTKWTAMGVHTLYGWYHHHNAWWSSLECFRFLSLNQTSLMKEGTQGSAQLVTLQVVILALDAWPANGHTCTFL